MLKDNWIFINTGNKVLLLLVWAPWSGKSTFVNQNGLEDYTISMDKYRLLIWEVKLSLDNHSWEEVAQDYNAKVAEVFWEHLEERMSKWLFTVVDNTNVAEWLYKDYHELASKYGYTIFFKPFPKDVDTLIQINKKRGSKEVNETVIKLMVEKYDNISANNFSKIRSYCHQIETIKDLPNYIPYELDDFWDVDAKKHFRKFYFIWDIQWCSQELNTFLQLHYDSDCCYVFTWDLLDRWYDNYWVLDIAYTLLSLWHNNIFFIRWNHDEYIERYLLNGRQAIWRGEFDKNTIPQIASFPTEKLELIASQFISSITIKWWNSVLFASHWGVNKLRHFISDNQLCKGVGKYEDHQICDENFAKFALDTSAKNNNNCHYFSIHWHRNVLESGIASTTNTFNLEWKVEYWWNLRIVSFIQDNELETNEFECINIQSISKK